MAAVQFPATTLLINESTGNCADNCAWCITNDYCHTGKSDYAFADGHAKALSPSATYTPVCMWTLDNSGGQPCWNSPAGDPITGATSYNTDETLANYATSSNTTCSNP